MCIAKNELIVITYEFSGHVEHSLYRVFPVEVHFLSKPETTQKKTCLYHDSNIHVASQIKMSGLHCIAATSWPLDIITLQKHCHYFDSVIISFCLAALILPGWNGFGLSCINFRWIACMPTAPRRLLLVCMNVGLTGRITFNYITLISTWLH